MRTREQIKAELQLAQTSVAALEQELFDTIDIDQDIVTEILHFSHSWCDRAEYHREALTNIIEYYIKRMRRKKKKAQSDEDTPNRRLADANKLNQSIRAGS
jgi:hypothetical protein